jgi:hypothetical protein
VHVLCYGITPEDHEWPLAVGYWRALEAAAAKKTQTLSRAA